MLMHRVWQACVVGTMTADGLLLPLVPLNEADVVLMCACGVSACLPACLPRVLHWRTTWLPAW